MKATVAASIVALFCFGTSTAAVAQPEFGDVAAGRTVAAEICSACHAIAAEESGESPLSEAPSFVDVAATPGMTATALFAWMTTSHPTMPNIILSPEELRNVVAYILSLQDPT